MNNKIIILLILIYIGLASVYFLLSSRIKGTMYEDTKKLTILEQQGQELYAQITLEGKENNQVVKKRH
ncbi:MULTISPECIES: hypothetical protein [Bacillus]|uniref:hypothetical protein n=1 Tax=Bacillus TaxID=1386 RepID=UPI00027985DD|nr:MULTISPECIES: hypothetical protein [Bacillus]EJS11419.1 hypothetical protein IKS_05527 [Bacillus cereus VDM062]MBJ7996996.1 hypothetical protein [Bacillus cereus]MBG9718812.1 hypothetical protein [Bacillus mycoides]MBJ7960322.1 hypothetical protein [Bacillus cereus group sp. N28]MCQ6536555.1 hypothetical protein [Bacillus mycoides]